ncbi:MAG TPA: hypothetical protein VD902_18425 [Symbiobacteriaceae bacterium]|nr:hypothetical protein [Symbiobacteriaceae bacterium]
MVDSDIEAGHQAVERARRAAEERTDLGPGTAGFTNNGAAYRGKEVAGNNGEPGPAEIGFTQQDGLHYNDGGERFEYAPAQRTGQ